MPPDDFARIFGTLTQFMDYRKVRLQTVPDTQRQKENWMLLPHGTVVALIDGKSFTLFRNDGNEAAPDLQLTPSPKLDAHNHSAGSHHSSSGNHAGTLVAEDAHAIAVVNWLNQEVIGHRIEHLVIVSPPRTIGELRKHYHKLTEKALVGELTKDLAGRNGTEVLAALRGK